MSTGKLRKLLFSKVLTLSFHAVLAPVPQVKQSMKGRRAAPTQDVFELLVTLCREGGYVRPDCRCALLIGGSEAQRRAAAGDRTPVQLYTAL